MVAAPFPVAAIVRSKAPHRARTVADAASMEEVLGYESPDSFAAPPPSERRLQLQAIIRMD